MNLIIDIGNTNSKIAIFDNVKIEFFFSVKMINQEIINNLFTNYKIEKVIISKVGRELSEKVINSIENRGVLMVYLSSAIKLPIINTYKTPQTLGQDRIAGVVGAYDVKEKKGVLVIDAGTCITYDFITENGEYLGGSISLGLMMRFNALNKFTTALPLIKKQRLDTFVGYNTETSIASGVQYGLTSEIEGFIEKYINKYGQIKVIMTGGDAVYLASLLKNKIFVIPELILIGLNKILNYNAKFLE